MDKSLSFTDVYFYATCTLNSFASDAARAAVSVLKQLGIRVHIPRGQSCCGQPAYNTGLHDQARQVARTQLKLFPEPFPIIVPSGSCAAMFKHHYQQLFNSTTSNAAEQAAVRSLQSRISEWHSFVQQTLQRQHQQTFHWQDHGAVTQVIFHPSCHSLREMRCAHHAEELLKTLANVQLLKLPHAKECCGFGGIFSVSHPQISTAMADNKIDEIAKIAKLTGSNLQPGATQAAVAQSPSPAVPTILLSNDFSCLMHLQGRLKRRNFKLRVCHSAEFINERITPRQAAVPAT